MNDVNVIKNPAGTYGFVGRIPVALAEKVKATKADVMGGRAFKEDGEVLTYKTPSFGSKPEAVKYAESKGVGVIL